jgi:hypothetical protein
MLKLLALGALGYAGYKYFRNNAAPRPETSDRTVSLAGGPLSDQATVEHTAPA